MLTPIHTKQFEKDVKRSQKRGKDFKKLKHVVEVLLSGEPLPLKYRDHGLVGNYVGRRECHLEPDWLLIYKLESEHIIFERLGTHADLF